MALIKVSKWGNLKPHHLQQQVFLVLIYKQYWAKFVLSESVYVLLQKKNSVESTGKFHDSVVWTEQTCPFMRKQGALCYESKQTWWRICTFKKIQKLLQELIWANSIRSTLGKQV